jgi:hypothetical protein
VLFHVVLRQEGPQWDPSRPLEEQSGWAEHAPFMDGLVEEGFIRLGGPVGGRRVVHVVSAESELAVRTRFSQDPWSGTHLLVESISPWEIRLGNI